MRVASRLLMKKAGILCLPPDGGGGWADCDDELPVGAHDPFVVTQDRDDDMVRGLS